MRVRLKHTVNTRDAGLRKLTRINRLIIAGSLTLTGVLADVAAHAFPGRTLHPHLTSSTSRSGGHGHGMRAHGSSGSSGSLQPPAEAPQPAGGATTESPSVAGSPPEAESRSSTESALPQPPASESSAAPESPAQESAPASEPAPAPEEPAPEPAPAPEEPAPVVSGGS